jgi:hypothetical protein
MTEFERLIEGAKYSIAQPVGVAPQLTFSGVNVGTLTY